MSDARRGSLRLIRVSGIGIYLHWSWLGIAALLLLGFEGRLSTTYPDLRSGAVWGLAAFGSAVFLASVLVHELAHAVMARSRGIEVEGITLYLFGGATEADASSRTAADELMIAVVGPLTSVGLAAVLWLAATVIGSNAEALSGVIGYLAAVNLILALFNMTPGLPLDGGRVFRSLVWYATGNFRKATRWAAMSGVLIGYGMIGVGLVSLWQGAIGGIWLAAIGWMISQGADASSRDEEIRRTFAGLAAADVMTVGVATIDARSAVADVVRSHFVSGSHTAYPVVDGGRAVGMLGLPEVRATSAERWTVTSAVAAASPLDPGLVVGPDQPMADVVGALARSSAGSRVLVVDDGQLLGIVSAGDIIRRQALASLLEDVETASR